MIGGEILIWLHLCAMAAYVGAQFGVIYMLIPAAETAPNEAARRKALIAGFKFYNPFTIAVLGIIVITGAMRLTDLKASMKFDYFARIGGPLELKLALAFLLIFIQTYITFGLAFRIGRQEEVAAHGDGDAFTVEQLNSMLRRIRAMVVDNLPGMQKLASQHGWVLQLCHFHLLLKLQAQRRGMRYTLRGGSVREEIHRLIRSALGLPAGDRLTKILERLRRLSRGDCGTQRVQTTVREFLKGLQFYRSYLAHPHLGLPHTTNSVESMGRLLRKMFRSSRSGSNPKSVLLWATAFLRMRLHLKCNGHQIN